jgi:poly(A) polymerase
LLRLSKALQKQLLQLCDLIGTSETPEALGYLHGADIAVSVLLLRAAMLEFPPDPAWPGIVATAASQKFPLKAVDLMPEFTGPALGQKLTELERRWIESGFTLGRNALLGQA